jgi:hypothetical protein
MNFKLEHVIINGEFSNVRAARAQDLTPAFNRIIDEWQIGNVVKFDSAEGLQDVGVLFSDGIYWEAVTPEYSEEKTAQGFDDHLMVRTGELMMDMTMGRGNWNWFEKVDPQEVMFGSINPKIGWNWEKRPAQFLDRLDRIMINSEMQMYLRGWGRYSSGIDAQKTFRQTKTEFETNFQWDIGE